MNTFVENTNAFILTSTASPSRASSGQSRRQRVRFVLNPFSGVSKKLRIAQRIPQLLDTGKYDHEICFTKSRGHATELSREAAEQNYDMVVAVGGDGSVNEVAAGLVGTQTTLGILPGGSGNGLAMHLGLGRDPIKAIHHLNHGKIITMDTGLINEQVFVNLAGAGFDAHIAHGIKNTKLRGFQAYFRQAVQESWQYQCNRYQIELDGKILERDCMVVEVANAPMFGYNFHIAPGAQLNDGMLEVVLIKKTAKWRYVLQSWRFLNRSIYESEFVEHYKAREVVIRLCDPTPVHFDGEGFIADSDLTFRVRPSSLNVLTSIDYGKE